LILLQAIEITLLETQLRQASLLFKSSLTLPGIILALQLFLPITLDASLLILLPLTLVIQIALITVPGSLCVPLLILLLSSPLFLLLLLLLLIAQALLFLPTTIILLTLIRPLLCVTALLFVMLLLPSLIAFL